MKTITTSSFAKKRNSGTLRWKTGDLDKRDLESEWGVFMKLVQGKQDAYDTKTNNGVKEGARISVN